MRLLKGLAFRIAAFALGALALLLIFEVLFRILPVAESAMQIPLTRANPIPRFEPNREFIQSMGWNFAVVSRHRTNNVGFTK